MNGRANLVAVAAGQADIRFDEGAAQLPGLLARGLAAVQERHHALRREERLLADVWAEGGAVLDHDARALTLFADPLWIGVRRAYLLELASRWPGWSVAWAARGVLSLAEAARLPADGLVSANADLERLRRWRPLEIPPHAPAAAASGVQARWRTAVLVGATGWTVFALSALHVAAFGPRALEEVPRSAAPGLPPPDLGSAWDGGSLALDPARRTLALSHQDALTYHPELTDWLAGLWPGWHVAVHHLGVPEALARAGLDPHSWMPAAEVALRLEGFLR